MGFLLNFAADTDALVALLSATATTLAVLVVAWPLIGRSDNLKARMKLVGQERESIRIRERAKLSELKVSLTLAEPTKLYKTIVDRLNLTVHAEDGKTVQALRSAGYRGRSPIFKFLAAQVIVCALAMLSSVFYATLLLELPLAGDLAIGLCAGLIGYRLPSVLLKNQAQKRQTSIKRAWPEALDLMLICVESGMSLEAAFRKVSEEIGRQSVELSEELNLTTAELSYLPDRRKALSNLAQRTNLESVRAVVTALSQAEKYGTPVGKALRVLAQESRDMRMAEAEKKAAALPPKLTVPMIVFFLPVLFAVIITPVLIRVFSL
ncbi:type II secretion system F family protein [Fulvimarina sp. 2208YS6-2-32]|uniref:Type II secretion system F family protein n=1 Tax=Fulvimarina uroteuthidis TaxID=3098149 RepID=A0ABU5I5B9_9HYPH|nr:type II secretion system F family protein [Fulvimarina sp. 2208YS6-2-32]MDY8110118.1 type II secretion system F family protein [Fulvimarina sp. 2208YS6-2-32]